MSGGVHKQATAPRKQKPQQTQTITSICVLPSEGDTYANSVIYNLDIASSSSSSRKRKSTEDGAEEDKKIFLNKIFLLIQEKEALANEVSLLKKENEALKADIKKLRMEAKSTNRKY